MNKIRKLWEQHVYWTRFFIISTAAELTDLEPVTNRLLKNPKDFAQMLSQFYCSKITQEFETLFTEHLTIAAELVNAAKNGDAPLVESSRKRWYKNADEIAEFLASINRCWNKSK